ncbi:MAG: sulfotransferase domain-containing protein [Cyanobacteria bacterium SBLK]|nr:sulfotransferase domain-containing protein [Cyanobacteria bacterium SBLK]
MKDKIKKIVVSLGYYSKPDFLIIGAQKAGTTALYAILKQHSFITASRKEIHFFDNDFLYAKKNSFNEYHSFFPLPYRIPCKNILFEATPRYLYHPKVPERLYQYNPNLKLIIILRDPAYRALSAWTMYHHHFKGSFKHDSRSFKEAVEQELQNIDGFDYCASETGYIKRGIYYYQVENVFKYFPREKVLVLENNELKKQLQNTLKKISSFLEIPNEPLAQKTINKSQVNNRDIYQDEIRFLKEFYKPYNSLLFNLIDQKYQWDT